MSTTTATSDIQAKYAEHAALNAKLVSLDYVPSAFKSNEDKIHKLQKELDKKRGKVEKLSKKTQSELQDFVEISRSKSKRFFTMLSSGSSGLEKKQIKEEKEWIEAMASEFNEKTSIALLEEELEAATKQHEKLITLREAHSAAKKQLEEIYEAIFKGKTKDFPEEDEAEDELKEAEKDYEKAQADLNRESQVNALLTRAEKTMKKAVKRLERAEDLSLRELATTNKLYEVYENTDLKAAKKHGTEAKVLLEEAKDLESDVRDVGSFSVPLHDDGIDIPLESRHADIQLHRLISASVKEATKCHTKVENELERSSDRLKPIGKKAEEKTVKLQEKREKLEKIRRSIFEKVHNGGAPYSIPIASMPMPDAISNPFGSRSPVSTTFPVPQPPSADLPHDYKPPNSNQRPILPAGGFRSRNNTGEEDHIAISSPTFPKDASGAGPIFPDTPEFTLPSAQAPHMAVPGFRVGADGSVAQEGEERGPRIGSAVVGMSFPVAIPWGLNPYAASVLLNAAQEASSGDESPPTRMPGTFMSAEIQAQQGLLAEPSSSSPVMPSAPGTMTMPSVGTTKSSAPPPKAQSSAQPTSPITMPSVSVRPSGTTTAPLNITKAMQGVSLTDKGPVQSPLSATARTPTTKKPSS
ncbi:hypothetical protein FRC02_011589 [Tulasnella sp. 418]|nr:hypothetical protein FRC02_011589 [Tulasnella sp. 418]